MTFSHLLLVTAAYLKAERTASVVGLESNVFGISRKAFALLIRRKAPSQVIFK